MKDPRNTKVICTLGPKTSSPDRIRDLVQAGMDVARLNFSHGDRKSHRQTIRVIRRVSKDLGKEVGVLQDLGGPKIRIGKLAVPEIKLAAGELVSLKPDQNSHDSDAIPVKYPFLVEDIAVGDRILLADGAVELFVKDKDKDRGTVVCRVLVEGTIQSGKGVNLPTSNLRVPAFTEKDQEDLRLGLKEGVDFVALSFIRHERDVEAVVSILNQSKSSPLLIAKIEKPQAVDRLEEIIRRVDGVMVARGDLGVEMPLEEVPIVQKRIIRVARQAGKPVITATQMLRTMVENPRPSRAEATDVANAILDGTDALMLSEETAIGAYPVEAVKTLDKIARATEPYFQSEILLEESMSSLLQQNAGAISRAACWLARDLNAAAIVACTTSGSTARLVARFRPDSPVIGLTDHPRTLRQLRLSWGVLPALADTFENTDQMFKLARNYSMERGIAKPGDCLIITAGIPVGVPGTTNILKIMNLDE